MGFSPIGSSIGILLAQASARMESAGQSALEGDPISALPNLVLAKVEMRIAAQIARTNAETVETLLDIFA